MPTGQTVVNNALIALGLLEQGGTPSVSDSNDCLGELQAMWEALNIDEGWINAVLPLVFNLTAATPSYTIGTGGAFNGPRPVRIYAAHMLVGVGPTQMRRPLTVVTRTEYSDHGDLNASAITAEEIFPDYNVDGNGMAKVYFWPVPTVAAATQVEMEAACVFSQWSLQTNYVIPYGYQDAVQYALAWRCIPRFGAAVAQQTAEVIRDLGMKAEARLTAANNLNRQKPPQPPAAPQPPSPAVTTPAMANFQGLQPR